MILYLITFVKTLFPNYVTFAGTRDQDLSISFEGRCSTHYTVSHFKERYFLGLIFQRVKSILSYLNPSPQLI